jgi:hypothetical protein
MIDSKIHYHYIYSNGKPYVTICFIVWGNKFSRGIAVCSYKDNPCKAIGRKIALNRALIALLREKNQQANIYMGNKSVNHLLGEGFLKYEYMPRDLIKKEVDYIDRYHKEN